MITFKQFLMEATMTGYHSTNKAGFENIELNGFRAQDKEDRLFPGTVSFTPRLSYYGGGERIIRAKLNVDEKDILRLTMKEFWAKAEDPDEQTPIDVGKIWMKYAKEHGIKVIIMKGVPGVGTEIAVLDTDIIGKTVRVD